MHSQVLAFTNKNGHYFFVVIFIQLICVIPDISSQKGVLVSKAKKGNPVYLNF